MNPASNAVAKLFSAILLQKSHIWSEMTLAPQLGVRFSPFCLLQEASAVGRRLRAPSVIAKMNKPLTEVFSAVKPGDCPWAIFNPFDDILPIMQEAFADPSRQSRDGLFVAMLVIENENSTHSRSLHEKMSLGP